jgi:aldehyde:ferredoxin oxidoreductase
MAYSGGYQGKVLRVNLTDRSFREEKLDAELARKFIGGAGFGVKYLFDEVDPNIDPLSPDNKLVFAPGPLTGTSTPCASRMAIAAKSPATGGVAVSMTGGYFPAEMKFAGYDVIIIEGKADQPVYLDVHSGKVTIRSAKNIWGMSTSDCEHMLKMQLKDQNYRIACIGPAGERLSRMAGIFNERRAAGRKGLGAVMGSKNLKAVAVRGELPVPLAHPNLFEAARKVFLRKMKESPILYSEFSHHGTPITVDATAGLGIYPARNWQDTGKFEPVDHLGAAANAKQNIGREHCYSCPVGCSQIKLANPDSAYAGDSSVPEYETLYSFGGQTGVDNLDSVISADKLSDELGLDTISTGVVIGFAMELYEKGIITSKDTDGLELAFGNHQAMVEMVRRIAFRQGFGDVLADGVKVAAEKIGKGSEDFAMHVKGLELPAYDVRGAKAHGLSFATAYTGADHNKGYAFQEIFGIPVPYPVDRFAVEGKGWLTKYNQDMRCVTCDCGTMCAFLLDMALPDIALQNTADLLKGTTGTEYTAEQVREVGERVNNLARVFNLRAGLTKADDTLPKRLQTEPIKAGGSKGAMIPPAELERMLSDYYSERGWTADGVPTREKLMALELDEAVPFVPAAAAQ